jgi:hypothetical protein
VEHGKSDFASLWHIRKDFDKHFLQVKRLGKRDSIERIQHCLIVNGGNRCIRFRKKRDMFVGSSPALRSAGYIWSLDVVDLRSHSAVLKIEPFNGRLVSPMISFDLLLGKVEKTITASQSVVAVNDMGMMAIGWFPFQEHPFRKTLASALTPNRCPIINRSEGVFRETGRPDDHSTFFHSFRPIQIQYDVIRTEPTENNILIPKYEWHSKAQHEAVVYWFAIDHRWWRLQSALSDDSTYV